MILINNINVLQIMIIIGTGFDKDIIRTKGKNYKVKGMDHHEKHQDDHNGRGCGNNS